MEYGNYKIVSDGTMGYFSVKPIGKGSVPVALRGLYTKRQVAFDAVDQHELNKKVKTNGKANTSN